MLDFTMPARMYRPEPGCKGSVTCRFEGSNSKAGSTLKGTSENGLTWVRGANIRWMIPPYWNPA